VKLVAFSGYARTGKDEAAKSLGVFGYKRVAFADKLRDCIYTLNPIVDWTHQPVRLQTVIDQYGWNGYKETAWGPEIRRLLQYMGTDVGRKLLSDNIWVEATLNNLPEGNYVVADCRFPNEAEEIRRRGGLIIRIERPGFGPANDHISEIALDDYSFDDVIINDSGVGEFHHKVYEKVMELI
jgi:hypothetical protein